MRSGGVVPPNTKDQEFPAQILTPEEVRALIGACSKKARTGIRNRALLTLLYRSGLRISEALSIRPSDVNMDQHSVRLLKTKSGKAQTRGFNSAADDALARWMDTRRAMGLRGGPLFCTLSGTPLHPQYARNLVKRLAAETGIEKRVHPHGLRHTFACELLASGMDVVTISKLLGHSSIAVTNRYLDHLTNDEAISALVAVKLPPLEV
jgi:site-specific recombinase XerD